MTTTPDGWLLPLAILGPFVAMLGGLALGGRHVERIAMLALAAGVLVAVSLGWAYLQGGGPYVYVLGGWAPPLGTALRADGASVAMLVTVVVVLCGIAAHARVDFRTPAGTYEARGPYVFWLMLLAIWGSLNLVFVSGDLFTLYVALELLTFSGVTLVGLHGGSETFRAALRYLLFALAGSLLYLLGVVLLYGGYGTLDLAMLAARVRPEPVAWAAASLMTVGLLAKTALFPLHLWLPPAHSAAPAAASAVLSALVINGSWFLVVRLWFDVMPTVITPCSTQLLAAFGSAAIVVGSIVALRQQRLKLLVAYSTVGQIGYLFVFVPLAFDPNVGTLVHGPALDAGMLQAVAHATAKAGMFMAAGLVQAALGHDRLADLGGVARAMPVTLLAFLLAGLALTGLVPSGAWLAKKLLVSAADESGQWWWTVVLNAGGALTVGYAAVVLVAALRRAGATPRVQPVSRVAEYSALALSACSLLLALVALGPISERARMTPENAGDLLQTILVCGTGVLLALGVPARLPPGRGGVAVTLRRMTLPVASWIERIDALLRRWPSASLALLGLAALFWASLQHGIP